MAKVFEDHLSENMTDMMSAAVMWVHGQAEKVFVYGFCDGVLTSGEFFYQVHGEICTKEKINEHLLPNEKPIPDPINTCRNVMRIIIGDTEKIYKQFKDSGREPPTEIRLTYDLRTKKFDGNLGYGEKTAMGRWVSDIVDEWMEEEKKKLAQAEQK